MTDILQTVRSLVNAGDSACAKGWYVPIHKNTLRDILDAMEGAQGPRICGYPTPGWQLNSLSFERSRDGHPDEWVVELVREGRVFMSGAVTRVTARSDVGPLEAWEGALAMARRADYAARTSQ